MFTNFAYYPYEWFIFALSLALFILALFVLALSLGLSTCSSPCCVFSVAPLPQPLEGAARLSDPFNFPFPLPFFFSFVFWSQFFVCLYLCYI